MIKVACFVGRIEFAEPMLGWYHRSNFEGRMQAAQIGNAVQYRAYSDKGFATSPFCEAAHHGAGVTDDERWANWVMAPERVEEEHIFGKFKARNPLISSRYIMKLQHSPVLRMLRCAALLTNIHSCLCGNQTALHFGVVPPTIDVYLSN